ncbi:MAG: hypothetical protein LBN39_06375 [Planctomycetaceae bacterium]|jgi:glucose uptake protein|nr:hypothetical protein [Planctomycetaceae bacterium]
MFILESYTAAVLFCVITMICWGSWGNSQKLAGKTWRYELFYWDYVFGVVLTALIFAFTLGSTGEFGRGFLADIKQAKPEWLASAFFGGIVFNAGNILLVASIAIAGLSVAFPIGIGLALVLGVLINFIGDPGKGNPVLLFSGVGLVTVAIIVNAVAYTLLPKQKFEAEEQTGDAAQSKGSSTANGILLAVACGILMSLFYFAVGRTIAGVQVDGKVLDLTVSALKDGGVLEAGKMTPYTANFVFTLGVLASSFVFVTIFMKKPVSGEPVPFSAYFKGTIRDHIWGLVGGGIWAVGMTLNVLASKVASPAVSYGLGQGATMVAAIWGVFVWKEFKNGTPTTDKMIYVMFVSFLAGLALIILAGA